MIVLVTGHRAWKDRSAVTRTLERAWAKHADDLIVVEGGCPSGADRFAWEWARDRRPKGVASVHVPAKSGEHHPDWCQPPCSPSANRCKGAGARRNQGLLDYVVAGLEAGMGAKVVGFKERLSPGLARGGTEDMLRRALAYTALGLPVHHFDGSSWHGLR